MATQFLRIIYWQALRVGRFLTRPWGGGAAWVALATVLLALFGIFCAPHSLARYRNSVIWTAYEQKMEHPLRNMAADNPSESHASKLTYRLTIPVVAHFLGFRRVGVIVWLYLAGAVTIAAGLWVAWRDTGDRVTSLFAGAYLVSTCAGVMAFSPHTNHPDGIALSFLVLALLTRSPWLVAPLVFLASWCDERGLIASSLVVVYHAARYLFNAPAEGPRLGAARQWRAFLNPISFAIGAVYVAYFGLRYYLQHQFHLTTATGGAGPQMLGWSKSVYHLGLWIALEGGWLLLLLTLGGLVLKRAWLLVAALLVSMGAVFAAAFMVQDVSRSLTYLIPLPFICFLILAQMESARNLRRYVFIAFAVSFLASNYHIVTGAERSIFWVYPYPVQLLFDFADRAL